MKHNYFLSAIFLLHTFFLCAQVAINKENPGATLDVNGNVLVQGKLYLENPGKHTGNDEVHMLVIDDNAVITKYDIENSDYGPLNYVQFVFDEVSTNGLSQGFNTLIDANDYTLAVHGFYFTDINGGTSVTNRKVSGLPTSNRGQYMEGHQFYAYVDNGTWWLRGFVNNSDFRIGANQTQIIIYMDVIIYRNDFITKIWPGIQSVDMGDNATGTAPLPAGF